MVEIPNYYHPGSTLSIQLATNDIVSVTVVRSFTPFTMSQVLLVRLHTSSQNIGVIDQPFQNADLLPISTLHGTSHHLQYLRCYALSVTIPETKVLNEGNNTEALTQ